MDKREACHRLAEINEEMDDIVNNLEKIRSRLIWDDPSRREWLLEREEEALANLQRSREEHDAFIREYGDIIYS